MNGKYERSPKNLAHEMNDKNMIEQLIFVGSIK